MATSNEIEGETEAVAEAIWRTDWSAGWDTASDIERHDYRRSASAAIAALRSREGAPEPSLAAIEAANQALMAEQQTVLVLEAAYRAQFGQGKGDGGA